MPVVPQVVEAVAAGATDPMLILSDRCRIAFANAAAERLLLCSDNSLHGSHADRFVDGASAVVEAARAHRFGPLVDTEEGGWRGEQPLLKRSGGTGFPVGLRVSTLIAEGELFACLSIRCSGTALSGKDDLAGRTEAELALEHRGPERATGLVVVDVDHFELVNESLGRAGGDQLLRGLRGLISGLGGERELVAHLEADRFAVVLNDQRESTLARGEQILEAIRAHRFRISDAVVRVTASAGACALGGGCESGEETMALAETALRRAKAGGRDRCSEQLEPTRRQARETIGWMDSIRTGIETGALTPRFQPILDLQTGHVGHYELLARIRDDSGALINPERFIPVAERLGLIGTIDRWAIATAIETLASWPDPDGPRIAVNTSGRSVGSKHLLACIKDQLERRRVDPRRLIVEVTETAAISSIEEAVAFGDELRDLGVGFSLDDFGAGFGTFYYLKHLPLDQVKIDGEFIRGISHSASDQVFVKALVGMAEGLGIKTVAEFVANERTLRTVRDLGVDYAQGFHIGRPEALPSRPAPSGRHAHI